jgi:hypothetical protein
MASETERILQAVCDAFGPQIAVFSNGYSSDVLAGAGALQLRLPLAVGPASRMAFDKN